VLVLCSIGRGAEELSYEKDIQPIFNVHCVECHSAEKREARLDLSTLAGIVKGGKSGPVIRAGAVGSSSLWGLVAAGKMPRDDTGRSAAKVYILDIRPDTSPQKQGFQTLLWMKGLEKSLGQ